MNREKMERMAQRIYLLIQEMAEIGEDYSPLQMAYNDMIECYGLPFKKIRWISTNEFEEI